jgi:uncharacterized protein (DUF1330 family)
MSVVLCVLLWSRPGADEALIEYENRVLQLVTDHGGTVLQRVRGDGSGGQPLEVQIIEFPSPAAMDGYLSDDRRASEAGRRDQAVARTDVIRVEIVEPPVP